MYQCPSVARACLIRVTRNDACGVPLAAASAKSRVMTTCFASLALEPHYENSDDIIAKDACGRIQVQDIGCQYLTRFNGTLKLAGRWVTPLMEMVLRTRPLMGDELATVGTLVDAYGGALPSYDTATDTCDDNFTLELWAKNSLSGSCAVAVGQPGRYVQIALPRTQRWIISGGLMLDGKAPELEFKFSAVKNQAWVPPVPAEWAAADAITELFAWRAKRTIPTSNVVTTTDGQCNFET